MDQPWISKNWWVSPFNYVAEVRKQMPYLPKRVKFHDVTLRDGEQTPGVVFRKDEKVKIAAMLDDIGVDRIEVALPAVSAEDVDAVKAVVAIRPKAEVFVLSRITDADIDIASECGVNGVVLEMPIGKPRLDYQFKKWSKEDLIAKTIRSVNYARQKGLRVVLFPMDCSRAEPDFLDQFLEMVGKKAMPDSVTLVDTTGCLSPQATNYLVRRIKDIMETSVEIHTHGDFGLGVGVSMAAVAAGAEVVHASVGGIGERTGNTALEEVAVALRALYGVETGIDYSKLTALARTVAEIGRIKFAVSKPIIGERAFTRESGMGLDLIRTMPMVLFALNPQFVGQQPNYVLGKKSGLASVEMKAADLGLPVLGESVKKLVLEKVKEKGMEKKGLVDDSEFRSIVAELSA
jgi:methanogen homocitrate synthase